MGDISLSIYSKFMCLKSNVEVHLNFSLARDQNVLFQQVFAIGCEQRDNPLRRY